MPLLNLVFQAPNARNQNSNPQGDNSNGQDGGRNTQLVQLVQRADRDTPLGNTRVPGGQQQATSDRGEDDNSQPFHIARLPLGYTLPAPDLPAPNTNINNQSLLVQLAATLAKAVSGG